jgi:glutathione synthase/RimK-type ligase-like ATP-grasp enzyme
VKPLLVIENVRRWPLRLEGAEVVSARDYLLGSAWSGRRGRRIYNLCRTYGYQTLGYYVSLLATARGHRPIPTVETLQDLRLAPVVRLVSGELDDLIQHGLAPLKGPRFELSIYFGRNLAKRYEALTHALYGQFPVPLLRATFEKRGREWRLSSVRPIATSEIPDGHRAFVIEQAEQHFGRRPPRSRAKRSYRYDLALLADPDAEDAPSDEKALRRFERAARDLGIRAERIGREDAADVAAYDALFIRETTSVDHPTYRLARRAASEGLEVIDDPISILRCTNKVFLAESFARNDVPHPATFVADGGNVDAIADAVGLPCVLKRPDSSFSQGVVRVDTPEELRARATDFLRDSELVVAQAFTPSQFDWRIGVLGGRPLFACRYHMARGHWQVVSTNRGGERRYGRVEALPLEEVPAEALAMATKAAGLIGDGFYGVDLKEAGGRLLVMEVNDNPNVDAGYEDAVAGFDLYLAVMDWFRQRLDARGTQEPCVRASQESA